MAKELKIITEENFNPNDLDAIGITWKDYCRSPKVPLHQKVLYFLVRAHKQYKGDIFFKWGTIEKVLNTYGKWVFKNKEWTLDHDYVTWRGIISSIKTLVSDKVIKLEYADEKKSEALDPENWIYRKIKINYDVLYKYANKYDTDDLPKWSRAKKYVKYRFYACVKHIKQAYNELKENIKKRYKDAREMFQNFLWRANKKCYKHTKNKYYDGIPANVLSSKESRDRKAILEAVKETTDELEQSRILKTSETLTIEEHKEIIQQERKRKKRSLKSQGIAYTVDERTGQVFTTEELKAHREEQERLGKVFEELDKLMGY